MTSKQTKKKSEAKLIQTHMGDFLSKKDKVTGQKVESTKGLSSDRKVTRLKRKMNMSFFTIGSRKDTEEYRNCYPGKKDREDLNDNYRFYINEIPSKPDGDYIDSIHANWSDDYRLLERHHGYIQWLFPIRDTGMNWHAQELQKHEIQKITKNRRAKKRVLQSYKMMLGFYGMRLADETDGRIERAEDWSQRFTHLNSSFHNYLRITRILKSLGELGYEELKANWVKFILYEGFVEETLSNCLESCYKFWIGVIREDTEREELYDLFRSYVEGEGIEKRPRTEEKEKGSKSKVNQTANSSRMKKQVKREYNSDDSDLGLQIGMDLLAEDSDSDGHTKDVVDKKKNRKDHEMSASEEEETEESQEVRYLRNEAENGSEHELGSDYVDLEVNVTDANMDDNTEELNVMDANMNNNNDVVADSNNKSEENTAATDNVAMANVDADDMDNTEVMADSDNKSEENTRGTTNVEDANDDADRDGMEDNTEIVDDSDNKLGKNTAAADNIEVANGDDKARIDGDKVSSNVRQTEKDDGTYMDVEETHV